MTLDTVVWIASMTKAIYPARAAMQLVEQGKARSRQPGQHLGAESSASVQVLEGFDASGAPRTCAEAPDHPAPSADAHRRLWLPGAGQRRSCRYYQVMGLPSTGSCENAALRAPLLFDPGEGLELRHQTSRMGLAR